MSCSKKFKEEGEESAAVAEKPPSARRLPSGVTALSLELGGFGASRWSMPAWPPCRRIDLLVGRQSGCSSTARSPVAGSAQQP
jgi:hypothetical protein